MHSENNELVKAGHELAKCLDSNTPLLDIAKMIVRLADKLDVTTLALREKAKQCESLAADSAALREVRASVIPEGYALVPQQIFLEPSDIESICSQCGDGHESGYGDFTDGLLWVGDIQRDDGSIVHGLHISSADYSEEGGVTVCEFAAQLRQGGAA
ncbi:hypothetical protein QMS90_15705 [Cronobacter sakazakii]|nr:hypothetical protein [Cronobacter sakazakii]